jgi:sulfonate transport system permease protein
MKRLVDIAWIAASSAVTAALVGLWQIVANLRLVNPVFLPGPDKAWNALIDGFASGQLGSDLLTTTQRMLIGWVLASLVGIALGALIGSSRAAREYLNPLLEFMRP